MNTYFTAISDNGTVQIKAVATIKRKYWKALNLVVTLRLPSDQADPTIAPTMMTKYGPMYVANCGPKNMVNMAVDAATGSKLAFEFIGYILLWQITIHIMKI